MITDIFLENLYLFKMKVLCLFVLAVFALVAGDVLQNEIPIEVNGKMGPYSQQFVYQKGDPAYEVSEADLALLEGTLGRNFIADLIENAMNDFRDVVINGNDSLPPLDPFVAEQIGPYEFTITGVRAQATINNFRAEGLQWYIVDYVNFNALRLDFGVHMTLPWLTVTGAYDTSVRLAVLLTHSAAGNFRIFLNRFEIGVDARLGTNLLGGHLILRQLDIKLDIHDTFVHIDGMTGSSLLNTFIASFVQSLTQEVVQTHMGTLSQVLSEQLFDTVNDFLKDYTLADIMG